MSKLAGPFCFVLAACATGGAGVDRETGPHARPRVELAATDTTAPGFPVAHNPRLPSADRLSGVIRADLGGVASADVWLCVGGNGRVREVNLVRGSSLASFDRALVHDVADWQFMELPGWIGLMSPLQTCEVATISYRPHR